MFKTLAFAAPTSYISKLAKDLRKAEYTVEKNADTMVAKDGDKVIARALKMGNVWCLRGDTDYIKPIEA